VSRVWLIEALARKRGVNELAAYLRMLGDHRTCSLLYPLSRLTYRNQKLPHSKRQIADLEPVPPADQVRPVSPRQHRGTFGRKHLPRRTHLPTLRGRTPALPAGHTCPERTPALPKDIGTMWRAVPGGTGPGRCGGRCQGVLGRDDVRHSAGRAHTCPPGRTHLPRAHTCPPEGHRDDVAGGARGCWVFD